MLWENRSWVPFVILVAVVIVAIGVIFIGDIFQSGPEYPTDPSGGCVIMNDRGDYDNSIDIVFMGDNYDDVEEFVKDTEDFSNSLLNVYPYSLYKDRFNFFRIESFQPLGCSYDDGVILCTPATVKLAGRICPHDYYVVLSDVNGVKNLFSFLRSSSWMGVNALNSADNKLVFAHEFAHSFGDFADEYEWEGGKITWDSPNCDSVWKTCPKFSVVSGSECWRGCVNQQYSRSVKNGIMRDYWNSDNYGVYNEYFLKNLMETKTAAGSSNDALKSPPVEILIVNGMCDWSGCVINQVIENVGYADNYVDDSFLDIKTGDKVASISNNILFSDYGPAGGAVVPEDYTFSVIVEKDPESDRVDLINNVGTRISSFSYSGSESRAYGPSQSVSLV
ncbi:MAG: hypothetical protein ABIH25_02605 [Candidatus Woesearchaeota archaeon]